MDIDLWIVALRTTAAELVISVIWPNFLDLRRWARRLDIKPDTRRATR